MKLYFKMRNILLLIYIMCIGVYVFYMKTAQQCGYTCIKGKIIFHSMSKFFHKKIERTKIKKERLSNLDVFVQMLYCL